MLSNQWSLLIIRKSYIALSLPTFLEKNSMLGNLSMVASNYTKLYIALIQLSSFLEKNLMLGELP